MPYNRQGGNKRVLNVVRQPDSAVMGHQRGRAMIDWQRVEVLQGEIGEDGFGDVVDLFLEETDDVIERLAAVPYTGRLSADLHFLKGSALNLGFRNLAETCLECERHMIGGLSEQVNLPALTQVYAESKAAFLLGLAKYNAA